MKALQNRLELVAYYFRQLGNILPIPDPTAPPGSVRVPPPEAERERALKDDASLRNLVIEELYQAIAISEALPEPGGASMGCVCPPTSEKTCQAALCPRRSVAGFVGSEGRAVPEPIIRLPSVG